MRSPHLSLLGLIGLVLASGLAFAALSRPSAQGVHIAYTVTLTFLLFTIVGSLYGRHRAFWAGCAVFGWGYAILALAPGAWEGVRPYLGTSALLNQLARAIQKAEAGMFGWSRLELEQFLRIGHCLAANVHAVAGGLIAATLEGRGRPAREEDPGSSPPTEGGPHGEPTRSR